MPPGDALDPGDELVLGVPRQRVLADGGWMGVRPWDMAATLSLVTSEGRFRPRRDAEEDPSWKQIIPYLLLWDGDRLFLMRRTRAGGDARLHERWSIGVGGHLGPADASVEAGLLREFEEELVADWRPEVRPLGLLNDDRTPVGRVHLGIVYEADARGRSLAVRERHKLSGGFAAIEEVRRGYAHLETWSQLLLDHLSALRR